MRFLFLAALALLRLSCASPTDEELAEAAGIDVNIPALYFIDKERVTIAIEVTKVGDVWYHMTAPATNSWVGFAMGGSMTNTRMLIAYLSEDGHNITNSVRWSSGHSEPVHEPDLVIDNVYTDLYGPFANTLSPGGIMVAHAVCRQCAFWPNSEATFDINSQSQPIIFAIGPNTTLRSNDPAAGIRYHEFHGTFDYDMTKGVNLTGDYGRIPAPNDPAAESGDSYWGFANYFSSAQYSTSNDSEWGPLGHAICMIIAFLLIFPLGAIVLRYAERSIWHAYVQVTGLVVVCIGFGIAVYVSKMYNKSKNFNSAHQIIGLLVFASLFIQLGLGYMNHRIVRRTGNPTIMAKIHRFLGIFILVLAIVNGGIGWDFAGNSPHNLYYAIVVVAMVIVMAVLYIGSLRYKRARTFRPEKPSFVVDDDDDESAEYEMQQNPNKNRKSRFNASHVQTPRTPRFGQNKWGDEDEDEDPEDYRGFRAQAERYTDSPSNAAITLAPAPTAKGLAAS